MSIKITRMRTHTISLRRLTDKTITKYIQLEKDGKLSKRQRQNWNSHKAFVDLFDTVSGALGEEEQS